MKSHSRFFKRRELPAVPYNPPETRPSVSDIVEKLMLFKSSDEISRMLSMALTDAAMNC